MLAFVCFSPEETVRIGDQLNTLNSSLTQLQSSVNQLQNNVTTVKNNISNTIMGCEECDKLIPELQKLTLDISISVSTGWDQVKQNTQTHPAGLITLVSSSHY